MDDDHVQTNRHAASSPDQNQDSQILILREQLIHSVNLNNSTASTASSSPTSSTSDSLSPSNTSPRSPPHSPSRLNFSRLRGLSYLRSRTQSLTFRFDSSLRPRGVSQTTSFPASASHPQQPQRLQQRSTSTQAADQLFNPLNKVTTSIKKTNTATAAPLAEVETLCFSPNWSPTHIPDSPIIEITSLLAKLQSGTLAANQQIVEGPNPPSSSMTRNATDPMAANAKDIQQQLPSIRFIPHHDPRATRPSLTFQALSRTLPNNESTIKVGRYSERDAQPGDIPRNTPSAAPVGFKSKVVSRRHCEFWYENSQWFVKDVKSSSGTFLNHLRLSPPGVESRPWPINDGDVVQLGIDFRGGEEMIFRCVKIRIELNRGWQKGLNNFNKTTHRRLRKLQQPSPKRDSDNQSLSSSECAICLMAVAPCQSLFVAPCSHVWHYKCIRPILNSSNYPQFLCPNCRAVTDLEAEIEEAESDWEEDLKEAIEASKTEIAEKRLNDESDAHQIPSDNDLDQDGDHSMQDAHQLSSNRAPLAHPLSQTASAGAGYSSMQADHTSQAGHFGSQNGAAATSPLPIPCRTLSPETRRYELMTNGPGDGPQTPRNDAGPFILDGGAGTSSTPLANGVGGHSRLSTMNSADDVAP